MSRAVQRRLVAIERQLNPCVAATQEIIILGGLPGSDDPTFASAGKMRWQRAPDESLSAFRARAMAAATAASEPHLIIGGLPQSR